MNVTRCDRCKRTFDEPIGMIAYQDSVKQDYHQRLDICPECLEAFKEFIRSGEAKHE